jgi:predicted component of type VI protein secretion system
MGFYERLSKTTDGTTPTLPESIARNLEAVLNAKEGYAGSVEVFGIGRYDGENAYRRLVEVLIAEMLEKVKSFEPRVKDPVISLEGRYRALWALFRLTGRCNDQEYSFEIFFHSVFRNVRVIPRAAVPVPNSSVPK